MKTFRILAALVMAVVCVSLSSCSKDDDEKIGSTDDLVGKWEVTWTKGWELDSDGFKETWDEADDGEFLIFKNDGTGYRTSGKSGATIYSYTWKLNGNKLTITEDGYSDIYQVETLNKSALIITDSNEEESETSTYKKVAG